MLNPWSKFPAIRLAIVFIAGIALHILFPRFVAATLFTAFVSTVIVIFFTLFKKVWLTKSALFLPGASVLVLVASLAYILTFLHTEIFSSNHFSIYATSSNYIVGIVDEPPISKEKTNRAIIAVRQVVSPSGLVIPVRGKLLVSFLKNEKANMLKYGDVLIFPSRFNEIEPPKNPEQFNYKEFMSFQNVYHQTLLSENGWKVLLHGNGNRFFELVYNLREQLLHQISKYVETPAELGVASALMLGYKDFITPEVTQAYAASGALHVLCVSGLHVGMVYLVLNYLFFFLNRTKQTRMFQTILIVGFIWCYACLTGLSPSVMRAATMFSMMALGKQFSRQANMFNTIGASALVLMMFNPFIMTEVGFKLSYLAVIGIVYLQPLIANLFNFRFVLLQKAWEITAVSIAAQAATFPLGLYYFHQFPNLFLVSNLVVIPAGWLLINLGIAMFVLSPISALQALVGKLFYWCTFALNKFIFALDDVPYSISQGVSISWIELLAIYAMVLLAAKLLVVLKPKPLLVFLFIALLLTMWNGYEKIVQTHQQKVVCYAVKKQTAFAIIEGTTAYIDFDSSLLKNESAMLFNIKHHWWKLGVNAQKSISKHRSFKALKEGYAVNVASRRYVVLKNNLTDYYKHNTKFETDVLLLTGDASINLKNVLKCIEPSLLVADASNKKYRAKKWKQISEHNNIQFYDVATSGAIIW